MTQTETKSFDRFNSSRITAVKNNISQRSDKFKDTVSKNIETARVSYVWINNILLYFDQD